MTLDEFMALAGTSNTGAGEYVSSGGITARRHERRDGHL